MKTLREFLNEQSIIAKLYEVILKEDGVVISSLFIVSMNTINAVKQTYPEIEDYQSTSVKFIANVKVESTNGKSTVKNGVDYGIPYRIGIDVERTLNNTKAVISKRVKDQEAKEQE